MKKEIGFKEFVALMAMMIALTALSIDAMLPALTNIGTDLGVTAPNDNQLIIAGGDASNVRDELRRGISELRESSEQEIMKLITKPKFQDFY